jgi:hypothetical protein
MKKFSPYLMMTVLSFNAFSQRQTLQQKKSKNNRTKEIPAEVQVKLDRLEEIKRWTNLI